MSGVTLISTMPPRRRLPRPRPPPPPPIPTSAVSRGADASAGGDVFGNAFHHVRKFLNSPRKVVVGHHARNRGNKAYRGRDQRFGDLGGDDRQICILQVSDAEEGVHDPVDAFEVGHFLGRGATGDALDLDGTRVVQGAATAAGDLGPRSVSRCKDSCKRRTAERIEAPSGKRLKGLGAIKGLQECLRFGARPLKMETLRRDDRPARHGKIREGQSLRPSPGATRSE
ncbi:hypothetical protein OUZ56_032412 [Daphnia magna]|uniref:Uncharacterized protein n=1 Tax=Daphnia magna TaxID=35525 RepID=A0ABR0B8T4_9CRUS|nr:hypothetical protein OUZ56_032412 [Daphnia magna]